MNLTNILEGIISGVSAALISTVIIFIFTKLFSQKIQKSELADDNNSANFKSFYKNPFLISLFVTSFMVVLTFFSWVYAWTTFNFIYLFIASFSLGFITNWIYNNQCPNCNRIFSKKLINKETLKEEKRPYHYRDETIYLYSDGSEKDRKYSGKEKTKMETWRTEKEFYECKICSHKWDKIFERNLDIDNRPKPNIVRTKIKPPNPFIA